MKPLNNEEVFAIFVFTGFLYFYNPIGLLFLFIVVFSILGFLYWGLLKQKKIFKRNSEKLKLINSVRDIELEKRDVR